MTLTPAARLVLALGKAEGLISTGVSITWALNVSARHFQVDGTELALLRCAKHEACEKARIALETPAGYSTEKTTKADHAS